MHRTIENLRKNMFLFQQLVSRDFKQKYKGTVLGLLWSVLNPLMTLLVMRIVFTRFFGRNVDHYTIYLFSGNIVMSYFREATNNGMTSLIANSGVIQKINVPKYLFLFSRNVSSFVNFLLTLVVYFIFCAIDGIAFTPKMFLLIFPVACLTLLNVGVGMILSALYIFFRDTGYLYGIFLTLLNYLSVIFYTLDSFEPDKQKLFLLNPIYVVIKYFRIVVINGGIPSMQYHLLCAGYALIFFIIGAVIYKKYNHRFVYYL